MNLKKGFSVAVLFLMVLGAVFAGGQQEAGAETQETYTIAVGWYAIDASTQTRMKYLTEELGPSLGLEFIFSDVIDDIGEMITFIENSYSAGADAVYSTITDSEQIAAKCNELGLYLATTTSRYAEDIATMPYNLGITGVDLKKVSSAYEELLKAKLDPSEPMNFLIVSGGAGIGVTSHIEATSTMLAQIEKIYGLNYSEEVSALTRTRAITDIETGSDIKVTIAPGFPNMDGYVQGISSLLQSGEYDVMLSVYQTTNTFATAVEEVEKALNKNIIIMGTASFGPQTKTAFETLDPSGNPSFDGAVISALTAQDGFSIMMIYNALTGHVDLIKPDGRAAIFGAGMLVVKNLEEYQKLEKVDTGAGTWTYTADEIKQLCAVYNPSVETADIMAVLDRFSTEDLIERRGF